MPFRELLEDYPLYRKWPDCPWFTLDNVDKPTIHMECPVCRSEQTFIMANEYYEGTKYSNHPVAGQTVRVVYGCVGCQEFTRTFLIKFGEARDYVVKVGQEPPWSIAVDCDFARMLGSHLPEYKKGLTCESQGYGIGAFAYYRRIVEELIDGLLDGIGELLAGEEHDTYAVALARTKSTRVAQDKIDVVKDLLPERMRPDGMNPLGVLHSALSEGLHSQSDERCLELAGSVREVLVLLVGQVATHRSYVKRFTEGMRKLLDKKADQGSA